MRKLSMMDFSKFIVYPRRFFGRFESCPTNPFTTDGNLNSPMIITEMPTHPSVARGIIRTPAAISLILFSSACANIFAAIVQRIVVCVVHFLTYVVKTKNFSVHPDIRLTFGIKILHSRRPHRIPIPLIEPIKIHRINDGVLSLRERDKTVGLVKRLSDCVSLHAAFWHWPTSNRLLLLSRNLIIASLVLLPISASAQSFSNCTVILTATQVTITCPVTPPPPPLACTVVAAPKTLQVGVTMTPIDVSAQCSGGKKPYTFAAVNFPPGITISPAGVISGMPLTAGTFTLTWKATDSATTAQILERKVILNAKN